MNKNLKLKYTKLAYIKLIKILINKNYNEKIINKNFTYKEIINLIIEYYFINNLEKPKLSIQSISNIKNRKLKLKPIERNKYTEDFVLFIKNKFNEFNIDLFFTISQDIIENKQIVLLPNIDENKNKIKNNIYNYWLLFTVLGVSLLYYLYNVGDDISINSPLHCNADEMKPTLLEEYPQNYIDINQNENKKIISENWFKSNMKSILTGLTCLTIGFALGLSLKHGFTNNENILITQEPWSLTPKSLSNRHGLLISMAKDQNTSIFN